MEEPRKVIQALYLGSMQVDRATGMDVLNDAISSLAGTGTQDQWRPVFVAVAPSMISILDPNVSALFSCAYEVLISTLASPNLNNISLFN